MTSMSKFLQPIQIMVFPNRFTVFCSYDGPMVKVFNEIDKRFWDAQFKTWSLPSSAYDKVMRYFASRNLAYETFSVDAIIYLCDAEIQFKFNNWFGNQDALMSLKNITYDRARKVFSAARDQADALTQILDNEFTTYVLRDIRTPAEPMHDATVEPPRKPGFAAYKRPNPFMCTISPL